jgi:hypothetical protein
MSYIALASAMPPDARISVISHAILNSRSDKILPLSPRQSWDLTRTLFAVRSLDEGKANEFIDLVYSEHEQFYNAQWKSKSQDELLEHLLRFAGRVIDDPDGKLHQLIESDQIYANAKRSIHYASVKQAWSTPTFFINHVPCDQLSSSSLLEDWDQILTELQPTP